MLKESIFPLHLRLRQLLAIPFNYKTAKVGLDEQISLPQVGALVAIADVRLHLGVASEEYVAIVRQLSSAIDEVESPSVASVALDALEVLVGNACPDPGERQAFVTRVAVLFQRWYRRIDSTQWMLLRRFGEELNVPDVTTWRAPDVSSDGERSPWQFLQGKRIGMYSLRESALRRAQAIIQELSPNARVETFHDRVGGSPALRAAATTADIFVIATAAAKHAATIFIEANRPKAQATVYARGQGSESLLGAIREYLLSL